uniref:Fe2OG dioxygenase domain-containing protein n=1 Tax=Guillardia theta (strain CCMP2712) TaxID=905079 RepID=A0A0C3TRR0_GUITC
MDGFTVNQVILQDECSRLIAETEKMGYSFWNPDSTRTDYRNADTIEIINEKFAQDLWSRIKHLVVPCVTISPGESRWSRELEGTWVAVGLNPNMLFNRYHPGGHFSPHTDGYTIIDFNTRSMYSALFYLNDCPKGGATRMMEESGDALGDHVQDSEGRHRFEDHRIRSSVSPRAGSALFFFQDTLHEGEPVGEGCMKYMIRSDILYQRDPKIFDEPNDREAYRVFREAELAEAGIHCSALRLFKECCRLSPGLAAVYGL